MEFNLTIEAIIFYVLLVDSIGANLVIWIGGRWYTRCLHLFARFFPAGKGWALLYLALVLWVGSLLFRMGVLF